MNNPPMRMVILLAVFWVAGSLLLAAESPSTPKPAATAKTSESGTNTEATKPYAAKADATKAGAVGDGLVPHLHNSATYLYFAVGLVAAGLMPYEVYFYSSGSVEERWKAPGDLGLNRINAILGFGLGGILSISLIADSIAFLRSAGSEPRPSRSAVIPDGTCVTRTAQSVAPLPSRER